MVVSYFLLKEKINRNKIIAVALIVTGVIVLNL
jgi:multidrug transporter EmrE-like cation transporter